MSKSCAGLPIDAACRHGLIWDHTVFHVVPNWRASPEIVAPSKHNCRIARVPGRARGRIPSRYVPGMSPSDRCVCGTSNVVCANGSLPEPRPRARRSPPPLRACGLVQFIPQPGQPANQSQDSMSSIRPRARRATATRWKASKSTSRSHRSQRSSNAGQQVGSDTAQGP